MGTTRLLTITIDKQSVYSEVVSNWLNAGGTIIQCGYNDGEWWAIATIDALAIEKPCDIPERTVKRGGNVPDSCWPWGEETEHTFYYDFVMFEVSSNA